MAEDTPASAYREVSAEDILSKYLSSNGESITKPLFRQVSPDQLESAHIYTKRQLLDYTAKKTSTPLFVSNKDAEPELKAPPTDPLAFRQERENEFEKQLDS
ncbi:MAG: hypothetical protein JNM63_16230, partial [Spirochaetia bacterium]|nr:hypothetical protein [Spirochaetia bacterium]